MGPCRMNGSYLNNPVYFVKQVYHLTSHSFRQKQKSFPAIMRDNISRFLPNDKEDGKITLHPPEELVRERLKNGARTGTGPVTQDKNTDRQGVVVLRGHHGLFF